MTKPSEIMDSLRARQPVEVRLDGTDEWLPVLGFGLSDDGQQSVGLKICGEVEYVRVTVRDEFRRGR